MQREKITVERFFENQRAELGLKLVAGEKGLSRVIREPTVNRPGLALAGFTRYFANKRVQVIGSAEATYLKSLDEKARRACYERLFGLKIPCVVICRGMRPDPLLVETANTARVPIFQSPLITMKFINLATIALEELFAPRALEMGSMVDILGIGVIIRGEPGIGKSESVLALLERGYSLVSDDVTQVRLVEEREVIGTSPQVTQNHMEVRGIGIINVALMFGVKSIRTYKRVDLVVSLRWWNEVEDVDRLGMEDEFTDILGIKIPLVTIPVRPGRDVARLIEVAAFQAKLKLAGINAAIELNERLIAKMTERTVR